MRLLYLLISDFIMHYSYNLYNNHPLLIFIRVCIILLSNHETEHYETHVFIIMARFVLIK